MKPKLFKAPRTVRAGSNVFRIPPFAGAAALALGIASSSSLTAQVLVAGIDNWDSVTAPTVPVTALGITASATASGTNGNWTTTDGSGRGASNDGTWGTFNGNGFAPTAVVNPNGNYTLTNAKQSAEVTLTITNNGASDLDLNAFHMDTGAFRPKAARIYSLDVLAGSDITVGNVAASDGNPMNDNSTNDITHMNGGLDPINDFHDDLDIDLTGLADSTLEVGGTAVFQITFSGGIGDGSGGHHLFLDNIAVSSVATTSDRLAVTMVPNVDTVAGNDFSVTVEAQNSGGSAILLSQDTDIVLSASGLGILSGTVATIPANSSSVTLNTVQYDTAETITLSAIRTSGDDLLGSVPSDPFNIVAAPASAIFVETAVDGSGEVVPDTLVIVGETFDVFAISRDAFGNFVANETTATFSLINITGELTTEDLFDNEDGSALFEPFFAGTANIRVSLSGFADSDSGLMTATPLVNRYDGGTNSSPNWSTEIVWLGDELPLFNNQTDLFFTTGNPTKRSTYLGPDGGTTKAVRSITVDEPSASGLNMSFVENGATIGVNLIFDTDSLADPAELNIDAAYEGTLNFGATNTSQADAGDIILADNLLITHDGIGLLNLRVDVTEMGGSYGITKAGTGTAVLSGTGSYTGDTVVNAGILQVTGQSIADTGKLVIDGGMVEVLADERVQFLAIGGVAQPDGVYGSSASAAPVGDDVNFSVAGTGTITVGPPLAVNEITITGITHTGTDTTITFSSTSNVDVYRSSDLLDFGATPYAADQPSGTYTDTAASGDKFFYILVSAGDPAP